jgi:hypothetical protein
MKETKNLIIDITKLKEKFAKLTKNDIMFIEGVNNDLFIRCRSIHELDDIKKRLHVVLNSIT